MTFRKSDGALRRASVSIEIHRTRVDGREIRYAESGDPAGPLLFFIHGAPGSLDDFLDYLNDEELREAFYMVSYDRPGYGYSGFGDAMGSMAEHGAIAAELIAKLRDGREVFVVGHSYGGTVALELAAASPGLVSRYVLLAPSASAEDERIFWFTDPVEWGVVNWLVPRAWRVANAEKTSQRENLRDLQRSLAAIEDPIRLIHGTEDTLVPIAHAYYLQRELSSEVLATRILDGRDHFLVWNEYALIKEELLGLVPRRRSK